MNGGESRFNLLGVLLVGIGIFSFSFLYFNTPTIEYTQPDFNKDLTAQVSSSAWSELWCDVKGLFGFPCPTKSEQTEYAIVTLREDTPPAIQQSTTTKPITVSVNGAPPTVINEYYSNTYPVEREVIKEVIVRDGVVDTSRFVTREEYEAQVDGIMRSIENSNSGGGGGTSGLSDITSESLEDLADVASMTKATGDLFTWTGSAWTNVATSSLGISGSGAVSSVNSQTGVVVLDTDDISEGTNQYFTNTRARDSLSSSAVGLSYATSTGVFSLTSGYNIPLTASTTEWSNNVTSQWTTSGSNIYYNTGNVGIGTTQPLNDFVISDAGAGGLEINPSLTVGGATGARFLSYDRSASEYRDFIFAQDGGSTVIAASGNVGIGTTTPSSTLSVAGDIFATGGLGVGVANTVAGTLITNSNATIGGDIFVLDGNINNSSANDGDANQNLIYNSSNTAGSEARLAVQVAGAAAGDPYIQFNIPAVQNWSLGVDNSDSDKFKIAQSQSLGTTDRLTIDNSGNVGIGTTTPSSQLTVVGDASITGSLATTDFVATNATTTNLVVTGTVTTPLVDGCVEVAGGVLTSLGSSCGTGSGGLTNLNGLTASSQSFATSTSGGLSLNITSSGGVHTFNLAPTSGYNVPLTASTTEWSAFYNTPSSRITAGTNIDWTGNTLNIDTDLANYSNTNTAFIDLTDLSSLATAITYNNLNGQFSLTSGYNIPLTASTTAWNNTTNLVNASSTFWDTAYSWGDHSTEGYLTGTAATSTFTGDIEITGSIIPSADITYDLGSPTKQWRDVYIGPGSLYINGKKVLEDVSDTITLRTDINQNLAIETSGIGGVGISATSTGNVAVTSAAGNISLNSGDGNIALGTVSGNININSSGGGNLNIGTSGGTLNLGVVATGTWHGTDIDISDYTNLGVTATGLTLSGDSIALTSGYNIPLTASTTEWSTGYASTTALTPAYLRGLFSNSATGLTYNSSTGATSLTAGYIIPLSASTTEWANKVTSQWTTNGSDVYYNTGNVGIGTTTPAVPLSIYNSVSNASAMRFSNNNSANLGLEIGQAGSNSTSWIWNYENTDLRIATNDAERMRITATGNVGIGTTTPSTLLHINGTNGTIRSDSLAAVNTATDVLVANNLSASFRTPAAKLQVQRGSSLGQGWNFLIADNSTGVISEAMRITNTGNVGIGTASPNYELHVSGDAPDVMAQTTSSSSYTRSGVANDLTATLDLRTYGSAAAGSLLGSARADKTFLYADNADLIAGTADANYFALSTNALERMRIDSAGLVGIGTTAPEEELHIANTLNVRLVLQDTDVNASGEYWDLQNNAGAFAIRQSTDAGGVYSAVSERLSITNAGLVGIGTIAPDARLHIYDNSALTTTALGLTIEQDGTGDALLQYLLTGARRWVTGVDNSDSDKFKISYDTDLADNVALTIDTTGAVGIGTASPSSKLDVRGTASTVIFKTVANGSASDGTGQGLSVLMGASGSSAAGTLLQHVSNDGSGVETVRNAMRFYDSGTIFTDGSYSSLMTILNTGNVGIGETAPATNLVVSKSYVDPTGWISSSTVAVFSNNSVANGSSSIAILARSSAVAGINFGSQLAERAGFIDYGFTGGVAGLAFGTAGAERLRIDTSGNVGIGTTAPDASRLHLEHGTDGSLAAPHLRLTELGDARETSIWLRNGGLFLATHGTDNVMDEQFAIDSGSATISTGGLERLRVNSSGNVGIGTTTPGTKLTIQTSSNTIALSTTDGTVNTSIFNGTAGSNTGGWLSTQSNHPLFFNTNGGNPQMTISTSGNVGIGTTTPSGKLSLSSGAGGTNLIIARDSGQQNSFNFDITSSFGGAIGSLNLYANQNAADITLRANNSGNAQFVLTSAGNVGIGTTSPVAKLHIVSTTAAASRIRISESADTLLSHFSGLELYDGATFKGGLFKKGDDDAITIFDGTTARLTVAQGGNVGIGNTSPTMRAHISGTDTIPATSGTATDNGVLRLGSSGTNAILDMGVNGSVIGGAWIQSRLQTNYASNLPLVLNPNGGNVGIGTTTPGTKLSVAGTVGFRGLTASVGAGSLCLSASNEVVYNSGSDNCLSSTRNTKHGITPLSLDAISILNALEPVSFIYNGTERVRYGFIAEDTASVEAMLATYNADGEITGIDDRSILSVFVKAFKEFYSFVMSRFEAQDKRMEELEARVRELEEREGISEPEPTEDPVSPDEPTDMCLNLPDTQEEIPDGYVINPDSGDCVEDKPTTPPDPSEPTLAPVLGCTDEEALNFTSEATEDDDSCEYPPAQSTEGENETPPTPADDPVDNTETQNEDPTSTTPTT